MKEYIHAQFVAVGDDIDVLAEKLKALGSDWRPIATVTDTDPTEYYYNTVIYPKTMTVGGKIHSACATLIKLRDPFLADRMEVSYISDELKDKYRK